MAKLEQEYPKNPIRIGKAFHHFRLLTQDVENTDEVFKIIRALTGNSFFKSFERFKKTPHGQKVLAEERSMLDFLMDRTPLAALPEGTLGRTYNDFMTHEGLTADGLAAASEAMLDDDDPNSGRNYFSEETRIFGDWVRDIHDLYHVTTGYGRDPIGELCLLSFTYAQTRNPGIGFIVLMGMLQSKRRARGVPVISAVIQAYRDGMHANWLPAEDWENMLHLPLQEVRERVNVRWPEKYVRALEAVKANPQFDPNIAKQIEAAPFIPIAPDLAAHA